MADSSRKTRQESVRMPRSARQRLALPLARTATCDRCCAQTTFALATVAVQSIKCISASRFVMASSIKQITHERMHTQTHNAPVKPGSQLQQLQHEGNTWSLHCYPHPALQRLMQRQGAQRLVQRACRLAPRLWHSPWPPASAAAPSAGRKRRAEPNTERARPGTGRGSCSRTRGSPAKGPASQLPT